MTTPNVPFLPFDVDAITGFVADVSHGKVEILSVGKTPHPVFEVWVHPDAGESFQASTTFAEDAALEDGQQAAMWLEEGMPVEDLKARLAEHIEAKIPF